MKYFLTIILFFVLSNGFAQDKWFFHSYGINYDTLSDLQSTSLFPKYLKSNDSIFYSTDCLDSCNKYKITAPIMQIGDSVVYIYLQKNSNIVGAFYNRIISSSKDSLDIEIIYNDELYKTINLSLKEVGFITNPKVVDLEYVGNNIVELTSLISYQNNHQNNYTRLEYYGMCSLENNMLAITIIPVITEYYVNGSSPKAIVNDFNEKKISDVKIYLSKNHFRLKTSSTSD